MSSVSTAFVGPELAGTKYCTSKANFGEIVAEMIDFSPDDAYGFPKSAPKAKADKFRVPSPPPAYSDWIARHAAGVRNPYKRQERSRAPSGTVSSSRIPTAIKVLVDWEKQQQ